MLYKIAFRDMKRSKGIYGIIIVLLVVAFLVSITLVSAVQVKLKKYSVFSEYLSKDGVFIESIRLGYSWDGADGWAYSDEDEIREMFPIVEDVLSVEELQISAVEELSKPVKVWSYSKAVTDALSVKMEEGRWFETSDMDDETLKAVVTYNKGDVNVGDILTLGNELCENKYPVEVIGVMSNRESLYYTDVLKPNDTDDYRDLYYTYDYEVEEGSILLILADEQILGGKDKGLFEDLNYTFGEWNGIGKVMRAGTILTFKDGTTQEEIDECLEKLKTGSADSITRTVPLSEMNENSLEYVTKELHDYLPVFISIIVFLLIAAVSANVITTKKQLKNYAIYYTCGLPWKRCARISLHIAVLTAIISMALICVSLLGLDISGSTINNGIELGLWQWLTMLVIGGVYILLAWAIPLSIVRRASAKEIMTANR